MRAVFAAFCLVVVVTGPMALAQQSASPAAASAPAALGPPPPPTGAEREELIRAIRAEYPTIPGRLVPVYADARRQLSDNSPCELLEWMLSEDANAPQSARRAAEFNLPTCRLPVDDLTSEEAREMLGERSLAAKVRDGVITVVAHSTANAVQICCSLQGPAEQLGDSEYWAMRRRLPEADRALLSFQIMSSRPSPDVVIRGPLAPPVPLAIEGPLQGQVLERQLASAALGETRKLTIYLPPGWSRERVWPVIYLTDGAALMFSRIVERMIADGEIEPVVMVSAQPAPWGVIGTPPSLPMDLRSAEYINRHPSGVGQDRFDRHMTFFAEELTAYAQAEFGVSSDREAVSVAGYSNGGVFALWAGLLHPDTFGEAIAMSPGLASVDAADLHRTPRARFALSGGLYEPGFARTARTVDAQLEAAGYEVTGRYLAAGHAQDQWSVVFAEAVRRIYAKN